MTDSSSQTRRIPILGFGGLLLLFAFAGFSGVSVVGKIQDRNEQIRVDYLLRNRVLQQLRTDIYLSGTYVRNLLLERDPPLPMFTGMSWHRLERESTGTALRRVKCYG